MTRPTPLRPSADINITPMIDVLLVLLVIIVAVIDASTGAGVNRVGIITDRMRRASY